MKHIKTTLLLLGCFVMMAKSTPDSDATLQVLNIINNADYIKDIRPPSLGPTNITVNMYVRSIDVDDLKMELKLDLTFRMKWRDQRIRFSQREVGFVTLVDFTKVWLPDPFFKNSVEVKQLQSIHKEAYIRIYPDGTMLYSSRFAIRQRCPMDLKRFPHDEQSCPVSIASYGYTTDDITFEFKHSDPVTINRMWTAKFRLRKFYTDSCNSKTSTGEYSCVRVMFDLERIFANYLMQWYIPCLLLVLISFSSQIIPIENVAARLIVTIAPSMTLYLASVTYSFHLRSPVSYITAFDVFTGMAYLAIFATLMHTIVGFYRGARKQTSEDSVTEDEKEDESQKTRTKKEKLLNFIKERGDLITRITVVGGYFVFVFLYLVAYLP